MKSLKLIIFSLLLFIIPFSYIVIDSARHKTTISIAIGSKDGTYYQNALKYQAALKKEGITLEIVPTKGSVEAQEMLVNAEVDFAFVQGGTENPKVFALANVEYEPIWIFYKDKKIKTLKDLKGKKIAISVKGSGILPTAIELLNLAGINGFNSQFKNLKNREALKALRENEIDAMFYVASPYGSLVPSLMLLPDIKLMSFNESESYQQFFIRKKKNFHIVQLYANSFDILKHIPKETRTLLSTTAILATYKSSDDMVRLMLKVTEKVHSHIGIFHDENKFPNANRLVIPQHPASKSYFKERENYYEENYSFWTAQTLSRLEKFIFKFILPVVTIFAFFIEVFIPAYNLYTRRQLDNWYYTINEIDTEVENLNLFEAKEKWKMLHTLFLEVRATDDIPATHMELFYTLQNQMVNVLAALDRQIKNLTKDKKDEYLSDWREGSQV